MPDPFSRKLPIIDGELRSLVALQRDTDRQLGEVRRQIGTLQAHELNLLAASDARARKADRLLDERLRAAEAELADLAEQLVTP